VGDDVVALYSNTKKIGGSQSSLLSISIKQFKFKNLFANLGFVVEKIFGNLGPKKSIQLYPILYEKIVMKKNTAILIFGYGGDLNTMVLAKFEELLLIDPVNNVIYRDKEIQRHLCKYFMILTIKNGQVNRQTRKRN
jgi:hypothetical protein